MSKKNTSEASESPAATPAKRTRKSSAKSEIVLQAEAALKEARTLAKVIPHIAGLSKAGVVQVKTALEIREGELYNPPAESAPA